MKKRLGTYLRELDREDRINGVVAYGHIRELERLVDSKLKQVKVEEDPFSEVNLDGAGQFTKESSQDPRRKN